MRRARAVWLKIHLRPGGRCAQWGRVIAAQGVLIVLWFALALAMPGGLSEKAIFIGSLHTSEQFVPSFDGFKIRMAELGYREGANIRYSSYNSKGDPERLKIYGQKLAQEKPDLIVTTSTTATLAAAKTSERLNIPILFLSAGHPQMLVKTFKSSGSNLAGISSGSLELVGKRFELLRELSPKAKKVAMPVDPRSPLYKANVQEAQQSAIRMGFILREIPVESAEQLAGAFTTIVRKDFDAIFMPPDSLVPGRIEALVKQAITEKLLTISSVLGLVKLGCLASYAADYFALGKQGAALAEKILNGAKVSELPIEMPDKFHLALNLKTARAIELKISRELLLRADQVIE